ncbi:AAA family ATPase [Candidatus Bathyarchaeota archaeon]|nr:AAA family ATPase [Candidatus Bathyarchaeota archaeon]
MPPFPITMALTSWHSRMSVVRIATSQMNWHGSTCWWQEQDPLMDLGKWKGGRFRGPGSWMGKVTKRKHGQKGLAFSSTRCRGNGGYSSSTSGRTGMAGLEAKMASLGRILGIPFTSRPMQSMEPFSKCKIEQLSKPWKASTCHITSFSGEGMIWLDEMEVQGDKLHGKRGFPFNLPMVRSQPFFTFKSPVTFFAGENGSGKSTMIESIACVANLPTMGGKDVSRDETLVHARRLAGVLRLSWSQRCRKGFFMRAEDFFNFSKSIKQEIKKFEREMQETTKASASVKGQTGASPGLSFALNEARNRYGIELLSMSHGEGFLDLFKSRMVPSALYILDEPEAPLSPISQLALLRLMKEMESQQCQFIIATHSPMLLAYPGATIYTFDELPPEPITYDALESVQVIRDFLNNPDLFLAHLFRDEK